MNHLWLLIVLLTSSLAVSFPKNEMIHEEDTQDQVEVHHRNKKEELLKHFSDLQKEENLLSKGLIKDKFRKEWLLILLMKKDSRKLKNYKVYIQETSELKGQGNFLMLYTSPKFLDSSDSDYISDAIYFKRLIDFRYLEFKKEPNKVPNKIK